MPRQQTPFTDYGAVVQLENTYRAHAQVLQGGVKRHIYGPRRSSEVPAQADLAQMRAAAAIGKTREQGLEIMKGEARRIQPVAEHEKDRRLAAMRRATASPPEEEAWEPAEPDSDTDPWLEYPDPVLPKDTGASTEKPELTPAAATEALRKFRPIRARPSDLEHLLESKADPNLVPKPREITPLQNVLTFARAADVGKMREMLLHYGAKESEDEVKQWVTYQRAAENEPAFLQNARDVEDLKGYDPCGAALDTDLW